MKLIKRGNTYSLQVHLTRDGQEIDIDEVESGVFQFNQIKKEYPSDDVSFDAGLSCFIVKLSQEDTLSIADREVEWEAGLKYKDGEAKRTHTNKIPSERTIIEEVI